MIVYSTRRVLDQEPLEKYTEQSLKDTRLKSLICIFKKTIIITQLL